MRAPLVVPSPQRARRRRALPQRHQALMLFRRLLRWRQSRLSPPPEAGAEAEGEIIGPTGTGYLLQNGRSIGRITAFGSNRAVRCYIHSSCSVAITLTKLPVVEVSKEWLRSASPLAVGDTKEQKSAKRDAHMEALRAIVRGHPGAWATDDASRKRRLSLRR